MLHLHADKFGYHNTHKGDLIHLVGFRSMLIMKIMRGYSFLSFEKINSLLRSQ